MINVYRSLLKAIYHSAEIRRISDLTKSLIISRTQNLSFVSHKIHETHEMVASYTRNRRRSRVSPSGGQHKRSVCAFVCSVNFV